MLKSKCIHPDIIHALAMCGHGDKILIADGNYPMDSMCEHSTKVWIGLTHGYPTVPQVLEVVANQVNTEKAEVMLPPDGSTPESFGEFKAILTDLELEGIERIAFYSETGNPRIRLAILTGDNRGYSNILLTVGVV